jgi:hypothetical protein
MDKEGAGRLIKVLKDREWECGSHLPVHGTRGTGNGDAVLTFRFMDERDQ